MKSKPRRKGILLFQRLVLMLIFIISVSMVYGQQQITVNGTVTDAETDEPLPGVNIVIQGTNMGTSTDVDGNYTIEAPPDATLIISFVGYQQQTVDINERQNINVAMEQAITELEEVVAIGYGTQKRVNVTGAVASVEAEELEKISSINSTNLLQGQMAGVLTKQSSGQPGADNVSFSIRGFGNPLVLIDGVERSLSSIDPSMIESISILKDASAAIYGARSGNGVVLVTTKRGDYNEDLQINYDGTYSVQQFTNKPELITDAGRYLELWTEAEKNAGLSPTYTEETIENYYEGGPGYESYNWFDYTFRDWTPRQKHNISVRGGGEDVSYYTGVGVSDQKGIITSDDWFFKRYNIRSNVDGNITDNLSASLDLNYIYEHQSEARSQMWRGVYKSQPMAPTHFPDTNLIPVSNFTGTHQRLVGEMNKDIEGGWDNMRDKFTGKFELNYDMPFVEGLSASGAMDFQLNNNRTKQVLKQWEVYRRDPETGEYILDGRFPAHVVNSMVGMTDRRYVKLKPTVELRYDNDFGEHSVNGLLVGEYIDENTNQFSAETENLLSEELLYLFLGDRTYHSIGQWVQEASRASFAGRLQYSYMDKYLLEGTFRYDASSYFPPKDRWGFFPSVSAGWRISEEPFMQIEALDNLKLRASYSETGYDRNAIPYDYFAGYNVYADPPFLVGSTPYRRVQRGSLPNESMTWEKMTNYNVGIDVTLWNGRLGFVMEGFYRKRSDILAYPQRAFPSTFGASLPQQNLNSMDDRGLELELSHNNQIGEFNYQIRGNLTLSKSKWIHFEEEDYETEAEKRIFQNSGKWQNRSIGYVSNGLFRSQEEIDNHPIDQDQAGNTSLIPGDIKYKDLNGDGVITWEDQKRIGYGTGEPDLNYGINLTGSYKGISLSLLLQGASMYAGNIGGLVGVPFQNASSPLEVHWEERFHPEKNPDGELPSVTMGERENNSKFSDFWLRSVTFLRIENVNLSYTLPSSVISPLGMQNLRIYVTANNLAVVDNLGIWSNSLDPEAPLTHTNYPPNRTITMGVNVTF